MPDQELQILNFAQPDIPELRFEWHPGCYKVYVIPTKPFMPTAELITDRIKTKENAHAAVMLWCRGYLAHKQKFGEVETKENLDDQQPLLARSNEEEILGAN